MKHKESHKRSILKTITWHILHIIMVATIAYVVTGSVKIAAILASLEMLWETFAYYIHERVWIKFGHKIH